MIITLIQYFITERQFSQQKFGFKDRIYGIVTSGALIGGYVSLLNIFCNFDVLIRDASLNKSDNVPKQAESQHINNTIQSPPSDPKRRLVQTFTPSF